MVYQAEDANLKRVVPLGAIAWVQFAGRRFIRP
jgi:hypothetical protein